MNQFFKSNKVLDCFNKCKQVDNQTGLPDVSLDDQNASVFVSRTTSEQHAIAIDEHRNTGRTMSNDSNAFNEARRAWIKAWIKVKQILAEFVFKNLNSKRKEIGNVLCDTNFKTEDVLIITGIIQIVLGLCVVVVGVIAYLDELKVRLYTFRN